MSNELLEAFRHYIREVQNTIKTVRNHGEAAGLKSLEQATARLEDAIQNEKVSE